MKKIIFFPLFLLFTTVLFAQTDFYYSKNGQKEYLKTRKDMVLIKCFPETNMETWVNRYDIISAYLIAEHLIIASIDSLTTNLNTFKRNTAVEDVAYVLTNIEGGIQMPSQTIFLRMKNGRSQ